MHMEARSQHQASSIASPSYVLRQGLSLNPDFTISGSLDVHQAQGILLSSLPQSRSVGLCCHTLHLTWVLEDPDASPHALPIILSPQIFLRFSSETPSISDLGHMVEVLYAGIQQNRPSVNIYHMFYSP